MIKIQNITSEPYQEHILLFNETEITIRLRFFELIGFWSLDVEYKGKAIYGVKLSIGTLLITSQNLPFDFAIDDLSNSGIDPFKADDFTSRCNLYLIETSEIEIIRNTKLEV